MKRVLSALLVPVLTTIAAAPASAATDEMTIALGDRVVVRSGTALVPVTVSCAFSPDVQRSDGTVSVTLTQSNQSGATTGTASIAVTCDNTPQTYMVTITSTDDRFRPGVITAYAQGEARGYFERELCTTHPDFGEDCDPWIGYEYAQGSDGPEELRGTASR